MVEVRPISFCMPILKANTYNLKKSTHFYLLYEESYNRLKLTYFFVVVGQLYFCFTLSYIFSALKNIGMLANTICASMGRGSVICEHRICFVLGYSLVNSIRKICFAFLYTVSDLRSSWWRLYQIYSLCKEILRRKKKFINYKNSFFVPTL